MTTKHQKNKKSFLHRTDGNATIEFVIWFPFIMGLFLMMVDVGFIFNGRAMTTKIVQDANRQYSVGALASPAATAAFVQQQLAKLAPHAVARTTIKAGVATTSVTIPLSDLGVTGTFSAFGSPKMVVLSQQYIEVAQVP